MTRKVHAYTGTVGPLRTRRKVTRYECMGCGCSYAQEQEALNCEIAHQAVLKQKRGEPLSSGYEPARLPPLNPALLEQVCSGNYDGWAKVMVAPSPSGAMGASSWVGASVGLEPDIKPDTDHAVTDHAAACIASLNKFVRKLETGTAPEDIGPDVELLGRMMARRT